MRRNVLRNDSGLLYIDSKENPYSKTYQEGTSGDAEGDAGRLQEALPEF